METPDPTLKTKPFDVSKPRLATQIAAWGQVPDMGLPEAGTADPVTRAKVRQQAAAIEMLQRNPGWETVLEYVRTRKERYLADLLQTGLADNTNGVSQLARKAGAANELAEFEAWLKRIPEVAAAMDEGEQEAN